MANFDKIKIDGTSYMVHDTATATALSAETQAREQAIQRLEGEIADLPADWQEYVRNLVTSYPVQTIGGDSTRMIVSGFYFIGDDGNFYRATKLIGQGVQIVDGTNCQRTYIGAMLATLQTSINNVDETISEQLEPLATRVSNIEANMNSLNVYNFDTCVFIGDSFLAQNPAWGDVLAQSLPGCRFHYNYPSGGGGFQISGANGSFLQMVRPGGVVYDARRNDAANVTFVLIEGGINDGDQQSAPEVQAVKDTISAARSLFPSAKIAICYNWASRAYPSTIWHGIAKGAAESGVPFCPNSYLWLWTSDYTDYFQSDQIHPTPEGTNLACQCLYQWLMNGKVVWPGTPQQVSMSNGTTLIWEIDSADNLCMGLYGTATSNTASLGTVPLALRPYNQDMYFPLINVSSMTSSNSFIRIATSGAVSTSGIFSSQNPVFQSPASIPARWFGFMGFTQ